MMRKKMYKPKDFALALDIEPSKVTKLARDIEGKNVYKFEKTVFGSYAFQKEDFIVIKDYYQLLQFFKNEKQGLEKLAERMALHNLRSKNKKPSWLRFIG